MRVGAMSASRSGSELMRDCRPSSLIRVAASRTFNSPTLCASASACCLRLMSSASNADNEAIPSTISATGMATAPGSTTASPAAAPIPSTALIKGARKAGSMRGSLTIQSPRDRHKADITPAAANQRLLDYDTGCFPDRQSHTNKEFCR